MGTILGREPAVIIGIIAAALLAALRSLAGDGIIGEDVVETVALALDPTQGGWALPIIVGAVTRFFVYAPTTVQEIANNSTYLKAGTPVDIGNPPAGPA